MKDLRENSADYSVLMIAQGGERFKNNSRGTEYIALGSEYMELWRQAVELIPAHLCRNLPEEKLSELEEIRLRVHGYPYGLRRGREEPLSNSKVDSSDLERIMEKATGASFHSSLEALRAGYMSYHGLRIGVCGTVIQEQARIEGFRQIFSLAIRIPRECPGLCELLIRQIFPLDFKNTILLSPPGGGKTTALRDMIRGLSERGMRISVIDERNELSGTGAAGPCFDLGCHTDTMIGAGKEEAAMMLLRAMNPQILAMDEISSESDCELIRKTVGCGVGILATAHASGVEDKKKRPLYRKLLEEQVFSWAVTIYASGGKSQFRSEKLS